MHSRRKWLLPILCFSALGLLGILLWGAGPTLACSFPSDAKPHAGITAYRINSGGLERCYLLFLPASYDPERPLPVVFNLHGFSSNPHGQRVFSRWEPVAEENYVALVYPQGTRLPQRWNADPAFGTQGIDDVSFIRDLIQQLATQLPIDRKRIYISGFSNGGAMTLRLACDLSDQVAAISTVAAPVTPSLSTCEPGRPVPLIAFHGTQDPLVPYAGLDTAKRRSLHRGGDRPDLVFIPVQTWVEAWARKVGCDPTAARELPGEGFTRLQYVDCPQNSEVILYTIPGGGHTWPGGGWIPFVGSTSRDLNASEEMWAFFERHPLP